MATEIKKFLDQSGVSTLWTRIAQEVAKVDAKAADNAADILAHDTRLTAAEGKIEALEKGTYDDTEVRNLIAGNTTEIGKNTAAITTLNSGADVAGSVAHTATAIAAAKVAEIVAGANADFDTLKEIADWILNDTTGAADMANDIKALENKMAGIDTTVVAKIAAEIEAALKVDGADKYALASDLTSLATRVKTLEDAGYQNAEQVGSAIDTKIAALKLADNYDAKGAAATAEANAKAYSDGLAKNYATAAQGAKADSALQASDVVTGTVNGTINIKGNSVAVHGLGTAAYANVEAYDAAGTAATALTDAKAYTDTEVAKIQSLTNAEILAAINEAAATT